MSWSDEGLKVAWTDEELKELGRIVVNFSTLDAALTVLLGTFVAGDSSGTIGILLADQMASWKLGKIEALANDLVSNDFGLRERLLDLATRVRQANGRRNAIFHSAFIRTKDDEPGQWTQFKPTIRKRKLDVGLVTVRVDDLRDLAAELEKLYLEVVEILDEVKGDIAQ